MAHLDLDSPTFANIPDWRVHDARNLRGNSKAERVLGVASYNNTSPNGRIKKKASPLNFSLFSDLKDALPTIHRKASRNKVQAKASDTESMDSTPSPTFDPAASMNSLDTLNSSPVTPKRPDISEQKIVDTPSQTEAARVRKFNLPSINENNQLTYLASSSESDQDMAFGIRKNTDSSIVLFQIDDLSAPQADFATLNKMSKAVPSAQATKPILPHTTNGQIVQDWLESAQLDRRPSLLTRSSSLPVPELNASALSSSSESIQTLTSEAKDDATTPIAQWPLPSAGLPSPRKLRRIHKSNLRMESVLSLSSDEDDSDSTNGWRKSNRNSRRKSNSTVRRLSRTAHHRKISNASSVIQLDSRPLARPTPTCTYSVFPKRSLADIAASAASRPISCDSWETDLVADAAKEDIPEEESVLDFLVSPVSDAPVFAHPLWRSSSGSSDIDIRVSRPTLPPQTLQTLLEEELPEQGTSPEDELLAEVNVADFPVPPRSRSGSVVPSIHVQHADDSRKPISSAVPVIPAHDTILLSPSMISRSSSTKSEHSVALRPSRQPSPSRETDNKQDRTVEAIMRKRTLSNVPIYVTGLESSVTDSECEDGDVAFFVYSSIF